MLVRHGALEAGHPAARAVIDSPLLNVRGVEHGRLRAAIPG
jgi:hypothetical protein